MWKCISKIYALEFYYRLKQSLINGECFSNFFSVSARSKGNGTGSGTAVARRTTPSSNLGNPYLVPYGENATIL